MDYQFNTNAMDAGSPAGLQFLQENVCKSVFYVGFPDLGCGPAVSFEVGAYPKVWDLASRGPKRAAVGLGRSGASRTPLSTQPETRGVST